MYTIAMLAKSTLLGSDHAAVRDLEQSFTVHDTQAVIDFLVDHPQLSPLLEEARNHVRRHFPHAPLDLRIAPGNGSEDDQQLVLSIATQLAPQAAVDNLRLLDRSWWLSAVARADGKLLLTLTFL